MLTVVVGVGAAPLDSTACSRLTWSWGSPGWHGSTAATPEVLRAEPAKLAFLRRHGADRLDLSLVPIGRRRLLAEIGRRSTNQALQRSDVERGHPVLLATLAETYVEVLDELVQLLDQALAGADSRARHELDQRLVNQARNDADRGRLLDEVLVVLADPLIPDDQAGRLVRARIGMPRLPLSAGSHIRIVQSNDGDVEPLFEDTAGVFDFHAFWIDEDSVALVRGPRVGPETDTNLTVVFTEIDGDQITAFPIGFGLADLAPQSGAVVASQYLFTVNGDDGVDVFTIDTEGRIQLVAETDWPFAVFLMYAREHAGDGPTAGLMPQ